MALVEPDPIKIERLARTLTIIDKVKGGSIAWVPTSSQVRLWKLLRKHKRIIIGKPRQVYASTATALYNAVWAAMNDANGARVRIDVVLDTDAKSQDLLDTYGSFLDQIGYPVKRTQRRLLLSRGSRIDAVTAGGNRIGASRGITRLHASEIPYWGNEAGAVWAGIHPSIADEGYITVETTMNVTNDLCRELWHGAPDNGLVKTFLRVEDESRYTADPNSIDDARWAELQEEGYTSRKHAAWFDAKCRELSSEEHAYREYPQREDHMFRMSQGRFVKATPSTRAPIASEILDLSFSIDIYRQPEAYGEYVIGVDTSEAVGRDASVAVCVDKRNDGICAVFYSADAEQDVLARAAYWMQRHYTIRQTGMIDLLRPDNRDRVPPILVEKNGVGTGTYQLLVRMGANVGKLTTDEASKVEGLLLAKRAIESGLVTGPRELAEECESCHRDKNGKFRGRKDLLMALGFCYRHALDLASTRQDAPVRDTANVIDVQQILSRQRKGWGQWHRK